MAIRDILKKIIKWFIWFYFVADIIVSVWLYLKLRSIRFIFSNLVLAGVLGLFLVREEKKQTTKIEWVLMSIFALIIIAINIFLLLKPSLIDPLIQSLMQ
jgi:predicted nucleic acid-binding Zn ribbon protein